MSFNLKAGPDEKSIYITKGPHLQTEMQEKINSFDLGRQSQ